MDIVLAKRAKISAGADARRGALAIVSRLFAALQPHLVVSKPSCIHANSGNEQQDLQTGLARTLVLNHCGASGVTDKRANEEEGA